MAPELFATSTFRLAVSMEYTVEFSEVVNGVVDHVPLTTITFSAAGKTDFIVYTTLMILSVQTCTFIFALLDMVKTRPSATESFDVTVYDCAANMHAETIIAKMVCTDFAVPAILPVLQFSSICLSPPVVSKCVPDDFYRSRRVR